MLPLADALAAYGRELQALPVESVPLSQALHRVLREPLIAKTDLPRHSQSALDGYVLTQEDAAAAPISLRIVDSIAAGDTRSLRPLQRGEAQRILTGARVPPNAGAVVAQERTEIHGAEVRIAKPLATGANIRWQGEEKKSGEILAPAGLRLNAAHLAAAAIAGYGQLQVTRAPRISVLVTGDELREAGSVLADGHIWDSNGPLVMNWLAAGGYGAQCQRLHDDEAATQAALAHALKENDLVLTTGGVSVGDRDYILPCAERLGVRRVFWEVAQKPGKPLYFGLHKTTALLGIPGNPAAVLVCLALHVRLLLAVLEGVTPAAPAWQQGVLTQTLKSDSQRDRLVRMQQSSDNQGRVSLMPLPNQDSHMLSNLLIANALAHLPARETAYEAGEVLRWISIP